jgi:putative membrane protein
MMFNGWCNFGQWGLYGWLGLAVNLVFWIGLILLAVWIVRKLFAGSSAVQAGASPSSAREILDMRYARGEITHEQYEQMKADIR